MNKNDVSLKIAEKTNFLNKSVNYLKNVNIVEYDIKSAGFSVIKFKKLLPEDIISDLEKMDKTSRNIAIGKYSIKYPKISEEILKTLSNVRKAFVLVNNIPPEAILSIKKDAMFLINCVPKTLTIKDYFTFRPKGRYTSYIYLDRKEFYYDAIKDEMDIKGLSEESKVLQNDYLLKDIKSILRSSEKLTPDKMFKFLKRYRSKYLNKELPTEVYRELDIGQFRYDNYLLDNISDDMLPDVDISQNYIKYILPIFNSII